VKQHRPGAPVTVRPAGAATAEGDHRRHLTKGVSRAASERRKDLASSALPFVLQRFLT
jgi:hypothetical protein